MTAGSPLQAPGCSRDIVFLSGFLFLAVTLLVLRVDPGPSSVLFPLSTRVCGGPARTSPLRPASREHLSPCLPRPVTPSPPLWSVRSSPGRARWGPAPCGAHRVALAGVLARAGPTHAAVCWFPGLSPPGVWPPAAQPRGSYVFRRFCPKLSPEREACTATGPRARAGRGFFIPVTGKGS